VNRSAGSFSRAFLIAAFTFCGTDARSSVEDASLPAMILPRIACAVPPVVWRLTDEHLVQDAPQRIDIRRSTDTEIARSGLM
jgi:hypothetical protein